MHLQTGYGFLSENADFAKTLNASGTVFLGPSPDAIHQLGDKIESKNLAAAAGVNIVPGEMVDTLEQALQLRKDTMEYPVLLKASAGGGGKGMRLCRSDQDMEEAWRVAKAEAMKFFNDDRLLLEKYVEEPHHIEFQIIAADKGNQVVVFPERDCSIQRRNQKVIEECPSVLLTEETRNQMAEQARMLCKKVGYESAGTIEFLVDKNQQFYFLEMNTRLQVEHPVTEVVCGNVDLVKSMLWVGAGWGLPDELAPYADTGTVPFDGHGIEARVYAEDPLRGFLPSTGPLIQYVEPSTEANTVDAFLRIESGVELGTVGTYQFKLPLV